MAYHIPPWLLQQLEASGQTGPISAPASAMGAYGSNALGPAGYASLPPRLSAPAALGAAPHYSELLAPYTQRALPAARTAIPMPASTPTAASSAPIAMPQSQGTGMGVSDWGRVGADLNGNLTAAPTQNLGAVPRGLPGLSSADAEALYSGGPRGFAAQAGGAVGDLEAAGAGGTGLGGRLAGMAGNARSAVLGEQGLGAYKAALGEGGLAGAGKLALGRGVGGLMISTGANLAAPLVGAGVDKLVPGTGSSAGDAVKSMGQGAGLGFAVAGAPGAVAGEALGGLVAVGNELGNLSNANSYDDLTNQFTKVTSKLPDDARKALGQRAYAGFQAFEGDNDKRMADLRKVAVMARKVQQGKLVYDPSSNSLLTKSQAASVRTDAAGGPGEIGPKARTRLAIQTAAARMMQPLANQVQQQGQAFGATIGAIPGVPPELAAYDAAQRQYYGNTTAAALTGAAYAQPLINDINSAVQQEQNYLAQINAAKTSGSGSTDFAALAKQLGIKAK